jgi:hypothetical protein
MYFKASATQSRRRHSLLVCAGSLTGAISALHSLWPSFQHSCIGLHARSPGDLGPTQSAESFSHSYIVRSLTGAMWALHSLRRASRTPALYARSPGRFGRYTVCGELPALPHCTLAHRGDLPYTVCRRASRTPVLYARSPGRFGRYTVCGELLALLHCTLAHRGDLSPTQSADGLPAFLHCTLTHRGDLVPT